MSIKAITPKGFDIQKQRQAIDNGLMAGVEDAKVLFFMSYHNWDQENYPEWEIIGPRTKGGNREVIYQTRSTPYVYVANGTSGPYPITPKNPQGFLRFKAGSTPKTMPGRLPSMSGAPGDTWVTMDEVTHPGIEARNPQKEVAEKVQPLLTNIIQSNISKVTGR